MPHSAPLHDPTPNAKRAPSRSIDDGFYSLARWRLLRMSHLVRQPMCCDPFGEHEREGRDQRATDVDHVVGRLERPDLEMVESNLQSLCKRCHSRKTRGEQLARRTP
jgi:5-methylcytosine-specific restriction protein A